MILVLQAHQYDQDGYLLGRWMLGIDPSSSWEYPEWWANLAQVLLINMGDSLEAEGYQLDLSRVVWWVPGWGDEWPEQPVQLPLRA